MKFWIDFGEKWTRRTRRTRSRSQKKKPPGQPIAIFKKGEERGRPVTCGYTTGQRTPGEIRIRVKRRCEHARARKSRRRKTYFIRYSFKGCRIEETRNCANLARLGRAHPRGRAGEEDCARERERKRGLLLLLLVVTGVGWPIHREGGEVWWRLLLLLHNPEVFCRWRHHGREGATVLSSILSSFSLAFMLKIDDRHENPLCLTTRIIAYHHHEPSDSLLFLLFFPLKFFFL